LMTLWIYL